MTKKTTPPPKSLSPTRTRHTRHSRLPRAHPFSPGALNASIAQRRIMKKRLKEKMAQKQREKRFGHVVNPAVKVVCFDPIVKVVCFDPVDPVVKVVRFVTNKKTVGGRELHYLEVPFEEGKAAVIERTKWLRGLRTSPLQPKKRGVEMFHSTSRMARVRAYYFV